METKLMKILKEENKEEFLLDYNNLIENNREWTVYGTLERLCEELDDCGFDSYSIIEKVLYGDLHTSSFAFIFDGYDNIQSIDKDEAIERIIDRLDEEDTKELIKEYEEMGE